MNNTPFYSQFEEGSFEYELADLLNQELYRFQQHRIHEQERSQFHPEQTLNDWRLPLDGLSDFQKALLQYYLSFKTEIAANLSLLKNCLQAMLRQTITIQEAAPLLQTFAQTSCTQLDQAYLDVDQHLGGPSPSSKRLILLTIHLDHSTELADFSANGKARIFFEKAILPIFITPYYDCLYDFKWEGEKKEEMGRKKEAQEDYWDMNLTLE